MDVYRDSRDEQIKELSKQVSMLEGRLVRDSKFAVSKKRRKVRKFLALFGYGLGITQAVSLLACFITFGFCFINKADGQRNIIANAFLISESAGLAFSLLIASLEAGDTK